VDVAVLAGRLVLAAVFATAAVAKLLDRSGTRAALSDFRVPGRLIPAAAIALPLTELAIAAALVPVASAAPAAIAAAALLALFSIAIGRALARGERVDCNCFGAVGSRPVGGWTLVRNLGLLAVAAFVAVVGWSDAGTSVFAWVGDLGGAEVALVVIAAVLGIAVAANFAFSWQLLKQNGRLVAELEALRERLDVGGSPSKVGQPAPDFDLPTLGGDRLTLAELLAERRGLTIVFSDPACGACDPLLPAIGRLQRDRGGSPLVVISRGGVADNRVKASEHGLETVLLEDEFRLARSLGINGMPGAVMLDVEGRLADAPTLGADAVGELLDLLGADGEPLEVIEVSR
jgi:peroxiredoxin